MARTRSNNTKKPAAKASKASQSRSKSSSPSQTKAVELYASGTVCAIVNSDSSDRFCLVRLNGSVSEGEKNVKGVVLDKKSSKKNKIIYEEGDEITLKEKDIIQEITKVDQKKGKKKGETEYEIDSIEISKIERLVQNLIRVESKGKRNGKKGKDESDESEEEVSESESESESEDEDEKESQRRSRSKSRSRSPQTQRQIKKVRGRKSGKDSDKLEVEDDDDDKKGSQRTRSKKGGKDEKEVSRATKKQKASGKKGKTTKKEALDESDESEDEEEESSEEEEESDDEDEEEEDTKKKGSQKKKETKKGAKGKGKKEEEESEEEDTKKGGKRGRSAKAEKEDTKKGKKTASAAKSKSSKKKDEMEEETPGKKAKKVKTPKFKRNKLNPHIEVVEESEMLDLDESKIIDYESVRVNNRNLIRAVHTGNYQLLSALLKRNNFLSNIFYRWAPEMNFNALELAFKYNDKKAVKLILDCLKKNELTMAHEPPISLRKIDSGHVSEYTFGVRVRKVAAARGGREGNNAFIADINQPSSIRNSLNNISRYDFDPELFELLRLHCGDHETVHLFSNVLLCGNLNLAAHIANFASKAGGWNVGFLHIAVLTKSKVSELPENIKAISVTKKTSGLDSVTPLHCAAINPNKEILEHLLEISPQYAFPDYKRRKPIHYAACCEGTGPLEVLINFGVDINEADQDGFTPLMYAAYNGRVDNVKLLLNNPRIVVGQKLKDRTEAIHWAALRGHVEVLQAFQEHGADINAKGRFRMTPLILASANGHFDCVEVLIESEAKINDKDKMKRNALMMAVRNGNLKIASYLLRHGCDFKKPDSSDNSALHYAAAYGFPECIDLLVEVGAEVNPTNSWNLTPLAVAMLKGNFHCVKKLLNIKDIDVNCKDEEGRTLITQTILAISQQNFEQIKFLVKEKKADLNIGDREGLAPLHHACGLKAKQIAQQNFPFKDMTDEEKADAIKQSYALKLELIQFLLEEGADVNQLTEEEKPPIHFALASKDEKIIHMILDHPNLNLLFETKSSGNIFNLLASNLLHKHTFDVFDKVIGKTKNQNDILNKTVVRKNQREQSQENILSVFLRALLENVSWAYTKKYEKLKKQWIAKYKKDNNVPHYRTHIEIPHDVKDKMGQEAKEYQDTFIEKGLQVLDRLKNEGAETPSKPYPLYQNYNQSGLSFIAWIFENFDAKKCDFNAKESKGEKEEDLEKIKEEEKSEHKTILHYLIESYADFHKPVITRIDDFRNYLLKKQKADKKFVEEASDFRLLLEVFSLFGVDFQATTRKGTTPALLFVTHYKGNNATELFKDLCHYKIDVTTPDEDRTPPVLFAAKNLWTGVIEYLAQKKVDINVRNKHGNTVLHYYVEAKDGNGLQKVLKAGGNPGLTDFQGRTPLHLAINRTQPEDMFEVESVLLRNNADVNAVDEMGRTPLHYSFLDYDGKLLQGEHQDSVECVASFCDVKNVDINIRDRRGKTPLHYAASTGAYGSVLFLLNKKAKLDIKDVDGNTPLALALYRGYKELASILIQNGASVHNKLQLIHEGKVLKKKQKAAWEKDLTEEDKMIIEEEKENKKKGKKRDESSEDEDDESPQRYGYGSEDDSDNGDDDENENTDEEQEQGETEGDRKLQKKQLKKLERKSTNMEIEDEEEVEYLEGQVQRGEIKRGEPVVPSPFFALAIRKNWQGVAYLLLQNGYNIMEAIKDALNEQKFRYVLALMHKALDDKILRRADEKNRNLFHIFAKRGAGAGQDFKEKIFDQLQQRGVEYNVLDNKNRTPLHYAAKSGFLFLEQKLLELGMDPNAEDHLSRSPFATSLVAKKLNKERLELYLKYKTEITRRFTYTLRDQEMQLGPIVYLASQGSTDKAFIRSLVEAGASINEADDEGWTPLIYAIRKNSVEMVQFYLSFPNLSTTTADINGKTPIHHVVNPLEYGSYENVEILNLVANLFDVNKQDQKGKAPIYYAYLQDSGTMVQALKDLRATDVKMKSGFRRQATSVVAGADWPEEVDYEEDAQKYIDDAKDKEMEETEENKIEPDGNADNAENMEVVFDDKLGAYSLYMTKVNVRKGGYGEYLFYRMQVLHDPNRDVYVLFTRWGRIGEEGGYQNTPFSTKEACIKEFKKIFHEKSRNNWEDKDNFQRVEGKYKLINIESKKFVKRKEYLKPIDFDNKKLPKTALEPQLQVLMRAFGDVKLYQYCFDRLKIDEEILPFGQITKKSVFEARDLLSEIEELLANIHKLQKAKEIDNAAILKLQEQIGNKSSRFYELIPDPSFRKSPVQPIDNQRILTKKIVQVESLLDFEVTSKILLGALHTLKNINPMDYIFNALSTKLVPLGNEHPEHQLIRQYVKNGYSSYTDNFIKAIFAVERKGEVERISHWKNLKNRMYLWHGSKLMNYVGILNQGLRIAPAEAQSTGAMFGKGIYFADMFEKSYGYSRDNYYSRDNKVDFDLVMLCEVALGEMLELHEAKDIEELEDPYKSVLGTGNYGPNKEQNVILVNGAKVPIGDVIKYEYWKEENGEKKKIWAAAHHNEYIVYDVSQVRIRYIVQVKRN